MLAAGVTVLSLIIGFGVEPLGDPVVIVKLPIAGGAAQKLRARIYGSQSYSFQDQHSELLKGAGSATRVVNDSNQPMTIKGVAYGLALYLPDQRVPPMTITRSVDSIDYLGPDEEPPAQVKSVTVVEHKHWLDW